MRTLADLDALDDRRRKEDAAGLTKLRATLDAQMRSQGAFPEGDPRRGFYDKPLEQTRMLIANAERSLGGDSAPASPPAGGVADVVVPKAAPIAKTLHGTQRPPMRGTGGSGRPAAVGSTQQVDTAPMRERWLSDAASPGDMIKRAITQKMGAQEGPSGPPMPDMGAAEAQASRNRLVAGLGRAGSVIGSAIGGQRADTRFWDEQADDADRPIARASAEREAVRKAIMDKRALDQQGFDNRIKLSGLGLEADKFNATREDRQTERIWEAAKLDRQLAHQLKLAGINNRADLSRAMLIAGMKADKSAGGRDLPAGEASNLGTLDAAQAAVEKLRKDFTEKIGLGSSITQYIPGTDAYDFKQSLGPATQTIGTVLEEGKLTDADFPKYQGMLPGAGSFADSGEAKLQNVEAMIAAKKSGKLGGLKSAGFDVSRFPGPAPSVLEERQTPDGRVLQRMSDGSVRVRQ